MMRKCQPRAVITAVVAALVVCLGGCTSFHDWIHNGLKVGPNYCKPAAPVAEHWIDAPNLNPGPREDMSQWWMVFQDPVSKQPDPVLNCLVQAAYHQNLSCEGRRSHPPVANDRLPPIRAIVELAVTRAPVPTVRALSAGACSIACTFAMG